jgi:Domain of unknown function (DUF4136)
MNDLRKHATWGLFLLPLALSSPTVNVAWKPGTDFGKYETYDWIAGAPAVKKLAHQRIVSAIENELAIKGWSRDDQNPTLHLSYYASTKDEVTIDSPYRTSWYDDGTIKVRRIHEGTLMLDMVDAGENELVWRGTITDGLSDDPNRNDSRIKDAIRKLLDGFPPG